MKKVKNLFIRFFEWVINLFSSTKYEIRKKEGTPPTKEDLFLKKLAKNRERIGEIMEKTTYPDTDREIIEEGLIMSAKLLNEYRRISNAINGFNDPPDNLLKLIKDDEYVDRIALDHAGRKLNLNDENIFDYKPRRTRIGTDIDLKKMLSGALKVEEKLREQGK